MNVKLQAWWLHDRLLFNLLGNQRASKIAAQLRPSDAPFASAFNEALLSTALAQCVVEQEISSGAVMIETEKHQVGQLIWLDQDFYFKDVCCASLILHMVASFPVRLVGV